MRKVQPRVIPVRRGEIQPVASWLYVWVDASDGSIAYVGATGFDPELRAFLHLTSDNPDLGRVRATVPRAAERDFDVIAVELPKEYPRPQAKQALLDWLATKDTGARTVARNETMPAIIQPIVEALLEYAGAR